MPWSERKSRISSANPRSEPASNVKDTKRSPVSAFHTRTEGPDPSVVVVVAGVVVVASVVVVDDVVVVVADVVVGGSVVVVVVTKLDVVLEADVEVRVVVSIREPPQAPASNMTEIKAIKPFECNPLDNS